MITFSVKCFKREDGVTELDHEAVLEDASFDSAKFYASIQTKYLVEKLLEVQGVAPAVKYYPLAASILDYVPKKTVNVCFSTVSDPHRDADLIYTIRIVWDNRRPAK